MEQIVVTRHAALVDLLRERGIIGDGVRVISHVTDPEEIRGKHVIGVLPFHLASLADLVTEIPLALTAEDRGREIDLDRLRQIAGEPRTYVVVSVR